MSCCAWTAFPNTNNVWGQVTGECADGKSKPSVHQPCYAGVQGQAAENHVTDKTFIEVRCKLHELLRALYRELST
jgi:hypothetical protein